VQYNCDCPELADKLAGIVRKYDRYVILAPYPTMKSRIALTAWTRPEDRRQAEKAGYALYLSKPVEPAELLAAVTGLLQRN